MKYLVECVEKLTNNLQGPAGNESLPYGIPGSSRTSGSQEEPIILSSDEDIKIKTEESDIAATSKKDKEKRDTEKVVSNKATESASDKTTKKAVSGEATKKAKKAVSGETTRKAKATKKAVSNKTKGKAPVRSSSSSSSSSNDSSSSDSSDSSSSPFYLKKDDMPRELREALRVNKNITY